ncbi:MAG: hypothetical protein U1F21_05530 [Sphaerotilus natans]
MLKSLFGDLTPLREAVNRSNRKEDRERELQEADFATTTIMGVAGEEDYAQAAEPAADPHRDELLVNGSPAQAMRAHFASSRKDTFVRQKLITICDPSHMWAASVIRALADASGQPIERLHLRDQTSLAPLADIERTMLPRRTDDTLKIYYADIQAEGRDAAEVQIALMERSDLSVVIVGPMAPADVESMLEDIHQAAHSLQWQCRNLLFMLPINAAALMTRIRQMEWPDQVRVEAICESLTSASAVWNRMLAHWQKLRTEQATPSAPAPLQSGSAPMPLTEPAPLVSSPTPSMVFVAPGTDHADVAAGAAVATTGRPAPVSDFGPVSAPMSLQSGIEPRIDARRAPRGARRADGARRTDLRRAGQRHDRRDRRLSGARPRHRPRRAGRLRDLEDAPAHAAPARPLAPRRPARGDPRDRRQPLPHPAHAARASGPVHPVGARQAAQQPRDDTLPHHGSAAGAV